MTKSRAAESSYMSCAEQTDYRLRFPALWTGLKQMGIEGLKRAIAEMRSHPERILTDGSVFARRKNRDKVSYHY